MVAIWKLQKLNNGRMVDDMNNEECAKVFIEAIKEMVSKPNNLDNFEFYLAQHFDVWMKKWASNPEGLAYEVENFAKMEI